jgi:beta-N-acetylhexosaminidase
MIKRITTLQFFLLISTLFVMLPPGLAQADKILQLPDPQTRAKSLLNSLSPEERVGQLFLVTFPGRDALETSQINKLITQYHIGGVILNRENDNFTGPENTIAEAQQLIIDLQRAEWSWSQEKKEDPDFSIKVTPSYIPLFISLSQEGDQTYYDQLQNGLTPLPDLMSIGATWNPSLAEQTGIVMGKELNALGVNLILGPSLDVLDGFREEEEQGLSTRTFGGDPYWVGEMGKAYILGIHEGGGNQVAVIAKHFPGLGGSDRSPYQEVATVRKSLEQLKQIELAPFFAVTGKAPTPLMAADGLLVSHIRYQGFQGNIRLTTRPVSFDSAALDQLMGLPNLVAWRQNGGILVSDNLGSQAIRQFFDPTGNTFDARQVARNAFLAGNDLLYLDQFVSRGDPDQYTTVTRTLEYFAQKYREDPAFAQRVDISVERLLTLKFRIYPVFSLPDVLPYKEDLDKIGISQAVTFEVAQKAATLLDPPANELDAFLPHPPERGEKIVFLTDIETTLQCSQCPIQNILSIDSLQKAVLRLYGPEAGGQVQPYQLASFSFLEVEKALNGTPDALPVFDELRSADWIVISFLNVNPSRPESLVVKSLLSDHYELLRNKRVIGFAFSAPYYLDATDVSKLTAYYALYSKTSPFVDVAARILFQELSPTGASPVSIRGLAYDLVIITSPDPNQIIPMFLDTTGLSASDFSGDATATLGPISTQVPLFKVGDLLPLRTGVIYDHNQKPVPDGTIVNFILTTGGESSATQQIEAATSNGVARAAFRISIPGLLEIRAASEPATISELLRLDVTGGQAAAITVIAPTAITTLTLEPSSGLGTPVPTPTQVIVSGEKPAKPGAIDWLLSMVIAWGGGIAAYFFNLNRASLRWRVRWGLVSSAGGLLVYIYFAFHLPGSMVLITQTGAAGIFFGVILGVIVGWGIGWLWHKYEKP